MKEKQDKDYCTAVFKHCERFFQTGKTRPINFRVSRLKKLKSAIKQYEPVLIKALYQDLGKSPFEAYETEIGFVLKSLDEAIRNLEKWSRAIPVKPPYYLMPSKGRIVFEPYGTVFIMAPFNYPFQLLIEPLIGSMAAGNCTILKPSELAPKTSAAVAVMLQNTFKPHYIACIEGDAETNRHLLDLPFHHIFFTGSAKVGRLVMEKASRHLTPVTLELGGKSPVIVDESADLKWAAERIIWGKTLNAGQTCVAPDYILVQDTVKDSLLSCMIGCLNRFYGSDAGASRSYGRIINKHHFDRLSAILDKDSACLVHGGARDRKRRFIEPAILDLPDSNHASMQEEIFGPVLPVLSWHTIEDAKSMINTMPTPLALYIFTKDKQLAQAITAAVSCGGVCINDTIEHLAAPGLPFGGVGTSGMGAYHGKKSFETFSHPKSVLTRFPFPLPFMLPPYTKAGLVLLRCLFR